MPGAVEGEVRADVDLEEVDRLAVGVDPRGLLPHGPAVVVALGGDHERRARAAPVRPAANARRTGRRGRSGGRPARRRPASRTIIVALSFVQGISPPAARTSATIAGTARRPEGPAVDLDLACIRVDPDAASRARPRAAASGASSTSSPRLTQFRRKIRAKLGPTTACTPHAFIACGDVLAQPADPEVRAGNENRVVAELVAQRRVEALEQVRLHLLGVVDVQELGRDT